MRSEEGATGARRRPRVVISRCLGFGRCRWNGIVLDWRPPEELAAAVDFIPVCPECGIGLRVPRSPILLVADGAEQVRLVEPAGGRDLSREMIAFSQRFLADNKVIDGLLLKAKSPSCGLVDTPVFPFPEAVEPLPGVTGPGLFARVLLAARPGLPAIDERRLAKPAAARRWRQAVGVAACGSWAR